jgi:hypothetical protein
MRNKISYTVGDGIGQLASSMFTESGRSQQQKESEQIRYNPMDKVRKSAHGAYGEHELATNDYEKQMRQNKLEICEKDQQYHKELEEMKRKLLESNDTIHPSKFKADVRSNMLSRVMKPDVKTERDKKDLSSSNYMNLSQHAEARSKGTVGSSLGYGAGLPSYQDTSSKPTPSNQYGSGRIGGSQFPLSSNVKDPSLSYSGSQSFVNFQQQDYP